MYPHLFSPITINKLQVKNRIVYPSMALLYSYDGKPSPRYHAYFRERARGGAGIVTIGPVGVDPRSAPFAMLTLARDEHVPEMAELVQTVQREGARAWVQLYHAGGYVRSLLLGGEKALAPSAVFSSFTRETPREMTLEEIRATQESFVEAAVRARAAGFDGIELIGSAGYLISQFLSPLRNRRTDAYGGSLENRLRFPCELIEMLRAALGPEFPLSIRMAGNDFVPGSTTDEETPQIAQAYEKAGVDLMSVTGGWHESKVPQLPMDLPRGAFGYLALNVKNAVSVPVIASNRIAEPGLAERMIRDGVADMVNLGRVLLADPEWPLKAKGGRAAEIRPCVACNQGCTDSLFGGSPVFCLTNPMAGHEEERVIVKSPTPKRVMVIGAGPAGCEAAITAAKAGHHVEIYEKQRDIGGQLWIAAAPPHKRELLEIVRFYRTVLGSLEIPVHLGTTVDVEDIQDARPDYVIVATGAVPISPPIPGIEDPRVYSSWTVLRDDPVLGKRIAVVGGGSVGLETALFLAAKGTPDAETVKFLLENNASSPARIRQLLFRGTKTVTVFEQLPTIGRDVGKSTRWVLRQNLRRYGVEIVTRAKVLSMAGGKIVFERKGIVSELAFDNVVVALGSRSSSDLGAKLEGTGIPFKVVGDCVRPAKIGEAIHEGFTAALAIDSASS